MLQPISGDISARSVARDQPVKLAAMEAHFETMPGAPLIVGGWPDMDAGRLRYAIKIPYGLSLLAFHDPKAVVRGLKDFPREDWPNVPIVHIAFQIMVALGTYLALVSLWAGWTALRGRDLAANRRLLQAIALAAPMGFIAIEAGWTVTEVGRQPWIIHGVLRTADAVTPMPGLIVPFLLFTLLYCFLGVIVGWLLYRQIIRSPEVYRVEPDLHALGRCPVSELGLPDVMATLLALSLNAYVLFGGADFGGGVWDLLASGPRRNRQREVIAHAHGPDLGGQSCLAHPRHRAHLYLFSAGGYARLGTVLHIPLTLMLIGIVLRGSAFTFRTYDSQHDAAQRRWGRIFASASVITPVLLGVSIGAVASGRVGQETTGGFVPAVRRAVADALRLQRGAAGAGALRVSGGGVPDAGDPRSASCARTSGAGLWDPAWRSSWPPALVLLLSSGSGASGDGRALAPLGAPAAPGHRGNCHRGAGGAVVPAISAGADRCRAPGVVDLLGLAAGAVSPADSAGLHHRGAAAPPATLRLVC